MKYLIENTDNHTLGEINDYFKKELMQTSLNKDDIVVDDKLKVKLGMVELERILDENDMANFYELGLGVIHLKHTGHTIEITDNEIQSRFEDAYEYIRNGLMGNLKLKVHWFSERPDENDDNDGKHFGIYIFDCLEKYYDEEVGYGGYDILEVFWFNNEDHRDKEFNCI